MSVASSKGPCFLDGLAELARRTLRLRPMKRQLRILVCEDNPIIAMSLVDLVGEIGHACIGSADRSDKARELASAEKPDLVLIDLNLADGWTGPDLVEYFQDRGIACVVTSGQAESFDREGKTVPVFEKPIDERRLAKFIEDLAANGI